MGRVDLHIHTTASDGAYTPFEVVQEAVARGLTTIAVTDHDTVAGIDEALEAARGTALEVVPGIELSAERGSQETHILGYYLDHHDAALQMKLEILRHSRRERAWNMVQKLAGLGMPLSWQRVVEIAADSSAFGRPHIAQALHEKGYVASINEAFESYIGLRGPAYVSRYKLTAVEAVEMIIAAMGLPVLAHPRGQEQILPELVERGLVGLEAHYAAYTVEETEALVRLAHKYDLICTGGSDLHGYGGSAPVSLGEVWVPGESVECLRALAMNRP